MRRRTRRILALSALLALAGGGSFVVWKAMKEGKRSQDPFEHGIRAERAGNPDMAERLYRRLLATKPDHPRAFLALVRVLRTQGKFDELESAARERTEQAPELSDGWAVLVEHSLMTGRISEAIRIARSQVARDPILLQSTLWRIQDYSVEPRRRLQAAESALRYSELANSPEARASAELFVVSTLLEIADQFEAPRADNLRAGAEKLRVEASGRLERAAQTRPTAGAGLLLERFQLLEPWAKARLGAADSLTLWLKANDGAPGADAIRHDLVRYHLWAAREAGEEGSDQEEPGGGDVESRAAHLARAAELATPLMDGPTLRVFRVIRLFVGTGADEQALTLLGMRESTGSENLLELLRCQLLQRAKAEEPSRIAERALTVLKEAPDWRIAILAHDVARDAGQAEAALAALEEYQRSHESRDITMTLAARMAQDDDTSPGVLEFVDQHLSDEDREVLSARLLGILDRAGSGQVLEFLDRRIRDGSEDAARYRLLRARYILRRRTTDGSLTEKLALAKDDVRRSLDEGVSDRPEYWWVVTSLALPLEEYEVAGTATARLIRSLRRDLAGTITVFFAVGRVADAAARDRFAKAVLEGVAGTPDEEWVRAITAMTLRGANPSEQTLEWLLEQIPPDTANVRSMLIIVPLALAANRLDVAEPMCRKLLETERSHPVGSAGLGQILLREEKFEEVVELYSGDGVERANLPPVAHGQLVRALLALDRKSAAEECARQYLEAHPGSPPAYLSLARVQIAMGRKDNANGLLASAPQQLEVQLLRASVLLDLERAEAAERVLLSAVRSHPGSVQAWSRMAVLLVDQERGEELIVPLTQLLSRDAVRSNVPLTRELLVIRAQANDSSGPDRKDAALADYSEAIRLGSRSVRVLNNAAWLILQMDRARLPEARRYIELALEEDAKQPNVNDTAAQIYLALGEPDTALERIEIALAPDRKKWSYRLVKARILVAKDMRKEAVAEIDRLLREEPPASVQQTARELRDKWSAESGAD